MLLLDTTVSKHTDELSQVDTRILAMQSEVAMIKLHLQAEVAAKERAQNVAAAVEQRIALIEQHLRNGTPAAAATPAHFELTPQRTAPPAEDPLQAPGNDAWATFLANVASTHR